MLIVRESRVEASAIVAGLGIPSVVIHDLGPEVSRPSVSISSVSPGGDAAEIVAARANGPTSPGWPTGPLEDTAIHAAVGEEVAVIAASKWQARTMKVKKPSAAREAQALLQHSPSRSAPHSRSITMESSRERTIAKVVIGSASPRAGSHTPASEGSNSARAWASPGGGNGAAGQRVAPCTITRSHQPASWSSPPHNIVVTVDGCIMITGTVTPQHLPPPRGGTRRRAECAQTASITRCPVAPGPND
jgi:hypothetical protein